MSILCSLAGRYGYSVERSYLSKVSLKLPLQVSIIRHHSNLPQHIRQEQPGFEDLLQEQPGFEDLLQEQPGFEDLLQKDQNSNPAFPEKLVSGF